MHDEPCAVYKVKVLQSTKVFTKSRQQVLYKGSIIHLFIIIFILPRCSCTADRILDDYYSTAMQLGTFHFVSVIQIFFQTALKIGNGEIIFPKSKSILL